MQRYYTSEEIAERYKITMHGVYKWNQLGYGPKSVKVGRRRLYPLDEVERFEAQLSTDQGAA